MYDIKLTLPLWVTDDKKTKTYWIIGAIEFNGLSIELSGGTSFLNDDVKIIYTHTYHIEDGLGVFEKLEAIETEVFQRQVVRLIWSEIKRQDVNNTVKT